MPLGTMVSLGLGNIVLDAEPAEPPRDTVPSQISARVCCGQTTGCIKMPLGTKVGLGPGRIVFLGDPAPLPKGAQPPNFWRMSIVAKRSPISATAEHLFADLTAQSAYALQWAARFPSKFRLHVLIWTPI